MPYQGSGGGGSKPKPKPTIILPWLVPQPKPKPSTSPTTGGISLPPPPMGPHTSTPSTANPPAERPTYGPENPAPPNYGGPGPVYPGISSAPKPTSSSSSGRKKGNRKKETPGKPHIALPVDLIQSEATPDISAFDLEFGWSSGFGSRQPEVGSDDELVAAVAKSVQHEGLFEHYHDDLKGYLKTFASYGRDEESDRRAEAYLQKYKEEMVLHYTGQLERDASRRGRDRRLGQAYRDIQHLRLLGELSGRAFFDTSAEISRLARSGVFRGRKSYGGDFGQYDLTEDEFNFGRRGLQGNYFGDMMNISGRGRLISVPVLASGPGGAGDSGDEGDLEYTYADVKNLVEMDVEAAASNNEAAHYDEMLESVFGFELILNDANDNQEDIRQMRNVAKAATMIVDYFAEVYFEGDENKALLAFQLLVDEVAHTQEHRHAYLDTGPHWHGHWHEIEGGALSHGHGHEHEQLAIYLEDDRAGGDDSGRAPLVYINEGIVSHEDELDNMYLGSLPSTVDDFEVGYSVGTILHEFGHVIDRRTGYTAALYEPVPEEDYVRRSVALGGKYGVNMDKQIPELAVEGFGTKEALYNELGIAPFVTDVVEVSGETLYMFSILPDRFGKYDTFGSDFYDCSERGGCGPMEIDWERVSDEANAEMTKNATALRSAFREVFGGFLHQLIEDDMHE